MESAKMGNGHKKNTSRQKSFDMSGCVLDREEPWGISNKEKSVSACTRAAVGAAEEKFKALHLYYL